VCALLVPATAVATAPSLTSNLRDALAAPGISQARSAALAIDLRTGAVVFAQNPDTPLQPASNEKLCVAYTALVELGPGYRFRTDVLGEGRRIGRVWHGRLVLKGHGDPTLATRDLKRLAARIDALGIRRITGRIVGDDSWFDDRDAVVGWLPSFVHQESAPLSALVANRGIRARRPAADPALAAAALFAKLLRARGIEVRDAITGRAHEHAERLVSDHSPRLATLLTVIDSDSDNFAAEMVLKAIGREVLGKGTSAAGAAVVRRELAAAGVPLGGVRIVDGSGLSREKRVTARELASLLVAIWRDAKLRPLVRDSLAVAGISGTLRHRLDYRPARGRVRAKTGTTAIASALSGYVGRRYAFVVLHNGYPVASWTAREAQDRFVTKLAALAASR
jgi:D-alanyl-D-alanine carboxypeptidase/D-alanyl-D-alanine-endopeptidase (penicillin-binding protein 4)